MNALLFGSHGFIGEHLCKALEHKGLKVYRVNRYLGLTTNLLKEAENAYIFNLAAYGNYYNQNDTDEMVYVNTGKVYRILELLNKVNYKAYVHVSTSSVILPYQTFYSASKAGGEYIARAYADKYNKPIIVVRPFTVIGPGDNERHLLPTLINAASTGEKIKLVPDSVHDYIDVRDLVSFMLLTAKTLKKEDYGMVYNAGTGIETSNLELLKKVEKVMNIKMSYEIVDNFREYDITGGWSAEQSIPTRYNIESTIESIMYEK